MKDRAGQILVTSDPPNTLDWDAFTAAYFPERRRHDFEALTAYGSHRHLRRVSGGDRVEPAEGNRGETSALAVWENEGGRGVVGSARNRQAV